MISDLTDFIGKHLLELTSKLNKEKRKYKIEKVGDKISTDFTFDRVKIKIDKDNMIRSVTTG